MFILLLLNVISSFRLSCNKSSPSIYAYLIHQQQKWEIGSVSLDGPDYSSRFDNPLNLTEDDINFTGSYFVFEMYENKKLYGDVKIDFYSVATGCIEHQMQVYKTNQKASKMILKVSIEVKYRTCPYVQISSIECFHVKRPSKKNPIYENYSPDVQVKAYVHDDMYSLSSVCFDTQNPQWDMISDVPMEYVTLDELFNSKLHLEFFNAFNQELLSECSILILDFFSMNGNSLRIRRRPLLFNGAPFGDVSLTLTLKNAPQLHQMINGVRIKDTITDASPYTNESPTPSSKLIRLFLLEPHRTVQHLQGETKDELEVVHQKSLDLLRSLSNKLGKMKNLKRSVSMIDKMVSKDETIYIFLYRFPKIFELLTTCILSNNVHKDTKIRAYKILCTGANKINNTFVYNSFLESNMHTLLKEKDEDLLVHIITLIEANVHHNSICKYKLIQKQLLFLLACIMKSHFHGLIYAPCISLIKTLFYGYYDNPEFENAFRGDIFYMFLKTYMLHDNALNEEWMSAIKVLCYFNPKSRLQLIETLKHTVNDVKEIIPPHYMIRILGYMMKDDHEIQKVLHSIHQSTTTALITTAFESPTELGNEAFAILLTVMNIKTVQAVMNKYFGKIQVLERVLTLLDTYLSRCTARKIISVYNIIAPKGYIRSLIMIGNKNNLDDSLQILIVSILHYFVLKAGIQLDYSDGYQCVQMLLHIYMQKEPIDALLHATLMLSKMASLYGKVKDISNVEMFKFTCDYLKLDVNKEQRLFAFQTLESLKNEDTLSLNIIEYMFPMHMLILKDKFEDIPSLKATFSSIRAFYMDPSLKLEPLTQQCLKQFVELCSGHIEQIAELKDMEVVETCVDFLFCLLNDEQLDLISKEQIATLLKPHRFLATREKLLNFAIDCDVSEFLCTRIMTNQPMYQCLSCRSGQFKGICYGCIKNCHIDHDILEMGTKNFACSCRLEDDCKSHTHDAIQSID